MIFTEITGIFMVTLQSLLPVQAHGPVPVVPGFVWPSGPAGWLLEPLTAIGFGTASAGTIFGMLVPFFAVVILGFIIIARREQKRGTRPLAFWLGTTAGLIYIGGAAVTGAGIIRAHASDVEGQNIIPAIGIAALAVFLGLAAMRASRAPVQGTLRSRIVIGLIGILGLICWAGLVIGPVIAMYAAVAPAREESADPVRTGK